MPRVHEVSVNQVRVVDATHLWARDNRPPLDPRLIDAIVYHHDGVVMPAGDRDYSGGTLDEDLERLDTIHRHSLNRGWGSFPYHMAASPNGRLFVTRRLTQQGSHVYRRNFSSLSMVLMGDFTLHPPGDRQLCAAGLGIVALLRHADKGLLPIYGHRQYATPEHPTACPGNTWLAWQQRLYGFVVAHAATITGA